MRKNIAILILSVVALALAGRVLTGGEDKPDLKAVVDEIGNNAEKCFLSGDVEKMLTYYCDDVVSMPDSHPMIKGKENLRRQTEAIISTGMKFKSLESTTLDAQAGGDFVYEIGTFSQSIIMPGSAEPTDQTGKYLNIYKRQPDGTLKIAVEIYNSNEPLKQ